MKSLKLLVLLLMIFTGAILRTCNSQDLKEDTAGCKNRQPVVDGQFYPKDSIALALMLENLFAQAEPLATYQHPRAILVPHAGYPYSGKVAASGFLHIDPDMEFDNIFILASSHQQVFKGASVYTAGNYETPLGEIRVNRELAQQLVDNSDLFAFHEEAHAMEHSLEVEIPFLQYRLKKPFKIVPIVTGTQTLSDCKKMAKVLQPFFTTKNLFIISSDFSHYPKYADAVKADSRTGQAILKNSPSALINAINYNASQGYENFLTSICGWPAVLTLLYISGDDPSIETHHADYQNSGDVSGDHSRVVGYHAIVFSEKKPPIMSQQFKLSGQDKEFLLDLARRTLEEYLETGEVANVNQKELNETLQSKCGAFVTLKKKEMLRGCIGRFTSDEPLYSVVQKMAVSAATRDPRFPPVQEKELEDITVEISVLTPLQKIDSIDEIEMGRHGIYIKDGFRTGTFLPQVAHETGWTKEEFLGHCARDKAGIGWEGWKNADIYIYEALVFNEKE